MVAERKLNGYWNGLIDLSPFEEVIVLLVAILDGHAYPLSVLQEFQNRTGKTVSLASLHATLLQLESSGILISEMRASANPERDGRRRRLYQCAAFKEEIPGSSLEFMANEIIEVYRHM